MTGQISRCMCPTFSLLARCRTMQGMLYSSLIPCSPLLFTRSRSSRSNSRSLSPPVKKKKRSYSPIRRPKKDKYDHQDSYYKERRSHKRKKHVRSRSPSQSPIRSLSKPSKKYAKEKRRSYTPDKVHRSRKHRNGQRDASPRYEKYDKYRRWLTRRGTFEWVLCDFEWMAAWKDWNGDERMW